MRFDHAHPADRQFQSRSNSVSRRLTRHVAEQWTAIIRWPGHRTRPGGRAASLLDRILDRGSTTPPPADAEQQQALALSDILSRVAGADVIVRAFPCTTSRFRHPESLDRSDTRAGKTFSYSDKGPQGLIPEGKQVLRSSPAEARSRRHAGICAIPGSLLRHMLSFTA